MFDSLQKFGKCYLLFTEVHVTSQLREIPVGCGVEHGRSLILHSLYIQEGGGESAL